MNWVLICGAYLTVVERTPKTLKNPANHRYRTENGSSPVMINKHSNRLDNPSAASAKKSSANRSRQSKRLILLWNANDAVSIVRELIQHIHIQQDSPIYRECQMKPSEDKIQVYDRVIELLVAQGRYHAQ